MLVTSILYSIPHYEALGDFRVEIVKTLLLTSGELCRPLDNGPQLAEGQPNTSLKKTTIWSCVQQKCYSGHDLKTLLSDFV